MATRVAFLLNLDADEELRDPRRPPRSEALRARIASLVARMSMLLRPDDLILPCAEPIPAEVKVLAFCPTPSALRELEAMGARASLSVPYDVLRAANRRAFSASLGQTLPGASYVRDMPALEEAIRGPHATYLLKRDFSFAGRERRQARGGELDASTRGFAARSFARGEGLQVEPWLTLREEFALHGFLTGDGLCLRGPLVAQVCDAQGRWQSSRLAEPAALSEEERAALERELERAAQGLRDLGYVGPFGVDAYRYIDAEGAVAFQPRSEINARFTMGYPRELLERALATT